MSEEIDFNFPRWEPQPDASGLIPEPDRHVLRWLKRRVVDMGGALVNAVCRPRTLKYPTVKSATGFQTNTCCCGNDTLALIPYERADGTAGEAPVCLVCDGAVAWPAFDPGPPLPQDPPPFLWRDDMP